MPELIPRHPRVSFHATSSSSFAFPKGQSNISCSKSESRFSRLACLRYTAYVGSSLERNHRHRLHLEPDLGIPLDLLDLNPYMWAHHAPVSL
jgi:hypothetical protein